MTIKTRHYKRVIADDGDECFGNTVFVTNRRIVIRMSRRLNKTVAQYAATLLHELLHVWIHVLGLMGFPVKNDPEERFVYAAERAVLKEFRKEFKRRKANGTSPRSRSK